MRCGMLRKGTAADHQGLASEDRQLSLSREKAQP
jgi:hypothetical protein